MAKNYSEKLENMLEEAMNAENRKGKVEELEAELKGAEAAKKDAEEKLAKIAGKNVKGKAEFDKYKSDLESKLRVATLDVKDLTQKIGVYKAYEEHGTEVLNIREYQMMLQGKLEGLEEAKKASDDKIKEMDGIRSEVAREYQRLSRELTRLMDKKEEVEARLKGASAEDAEKLKAERKELIDKIDKNNEAYQKNTAKNGKLAELAKEKDHNKELAEEMSKVQVTIGKCNLIWTSLLKGKDWDEIQSTLSKVDFKAKKGTINKIRELNKRDKETELEAGREENPARGEQGQEEQRAQNPQTNNPEQGQAGQGTQAPQQENPGQAEETETPEEENPEQEGDTDNLPKKSWIQKHPRLAKAISHIPFVGRGVKAKLEAQAEQAEEVGEPTEEPAEEAQEFEDISSSSGEQNRAEKDLKYVSKQIEKGRESEIFESIAKKGLRETVAVDVETKARLAKVEAANREAAKFDKSSRYQRQAEDVADKAAEADRDEK